MAYSVGSNSKNKSHKAKSARLLKKFEAAHEVFAFIGTYHPDEHDDIKAAYNNARKALLQHMNGAV